MGGEDASAEAVARVSSTSTSASGIGPRGPGLPKDEYRRLKKAGMLPPKDPAVEAAKVKSAAKKADKGKVAKQVVGEEDGDVKGRLGGMVVLYASQTGNAHNLAKDLYEDASEKGFSVEVTDMADMDFVAFLQVVFLKIPFASTIPVRLQKTHLREQRCLSKDSYSILATILIHKPGLSRTQWFSHRCSPSRCGQQYGFHLSRKIVFRLFGIFRFHSFWLFSCCQYPIPEFLCLRLW
jgi:hypothetical protein